MQPSESDNLTLIAACAFGLEAIVKRELIKLGYDAKVSQPGRVEFAGTWDDVCKTNIWLRTADRVLVKVLEFPSEDFDSLFETVREHEWADLIAADSEVHITGRSRLSQLTSVPAVQRTVKKAIVESLQRGHGTSELPETGATYKIDVALLNDTATLTLDTTGDSLHKRGYRKLAGQAPIKETLAAAMIDLSVWRPERILVDPFCGTGTIPIEAAMAGMNIAPGLNRDFTSSDWPQTGQQKWSDAVEDARAQIIQDVDLQIIGSDVDEDSLSMARYHAKQAGVEKQIHFRQQPFQEFESRQKYGCVVTNPPYGERLQEIEEVRPLYESFPRVLQKLETWSLYLITNMPKLEAIFQKSATRRRKLFNGRIECTYFQYLGPRPPKGYFDDDYVESAESSASSNLSGKALAAGTESVVPKQKIPEPEQRLAERAHGSVSLGNKPAASALPLNEEALPEEKQGGNIWETARANRANKVESKPEVAPIFGGLQAKDREQAELFRSRLTKRARHLLSLIHI